MTNLGDHNTCLSIETKVTFCTPFDPFSFERLESFCQDIWMSQLWHFLYIDFVVHYLLRNVISSVKSSLSKRLVKLILYAFQDWRHSSRLEHQRFVTESGQDMLNKEYLLQMTFLPWFLLILEWLEWQDDSHPLLAFYERLSTRRGNWKDSEKNMTDNSNQMRKAFLVLLFVPKLKSLKHGFTLYTLWEILFWLKKEWESQTGR